MKTTIESTGLDDQNRARREGAELWEKTKPLLDELVQSRLELKRLQAIGADKAAIMRGVRTAWIEAHIEDVIHSKKPALVGKPRCRWTGILMRYYERYGIAAPDIETVRRVVYEFNGF